MKDEKNGDKTMKNEVENVKIKLNPQKINTPRLDSLFGVI
jgi:hypothetical protein